MNSETTNTVSQTKPQAKISDFIPKYKCHKEVHAGKIREIQFDWQKAQQENRETDGGANLLLENGVSVKVSSEYLKKHSPQLGGYFVAYEDGYLSFSPEGPFEAGYTRVE